MPNISKRVLVIGFLYFLISLFHQNIVYADMIGITWGDSRLVSFDPYSGDITMEHTQLNPDESFTGLTYDPNHDILYALSQVENNLYSIDAKTLEVNLIGNLNIGGTRSWNDANALAYDPNNDKLYTVTQDWDGNGTNSRGQLAEINTTDAQLSIIGDISGLVISLDYNEIDNQLYGQAVYGWGSWDSSYKSTVISIDPTSASSTQLFETPYHTVGGFAQLGDDDKYISWVNWTSHFYAEIDLSDQTVTQLAEADIGVDWALTYKDFFVAPAYDLMVTTTKTSITDHLTLGDTFSFDYWWEMGMEPTDGNFDVLFFNGTEWETFGWELNFDGSSTDWETASFRIPPWLRGHDVQIMFSLLDRGQVTDPIVYLRNIGSSSTPVP